MDPTTVVLRNQSWGDATGPTNQGAADPSPRGQGFYLRGKCPFTTRISSLARGPSGVAMALLVNRDALLVLEEEV